MLLAKGNVSTVVSCSARVCMCVCVCVYVCVRAEGKLSSLKTSNWALPDQSGPEFRLVLLRIHYNSNTGRENLMVALGTRLTLNT